MIILHISLFEIFFSGIFIPVCKSPVGEKNEICHGLLVTVWT
jgi:hypothetical protein